MLAAIIFGVAYVLVLVAAYSALEAEAWRIVSLSLTVGVIAAFFLVTMIGSDRARATEFELEFARTVEAHLAAGETLVAASPLGGILSEYARAADDQRRAAREHSYAAGPAVYGAGFALLAVLCFGLSYVTGAPAGLVVLGLLSELVAFVLLALLAGILVLSVGRPAEVPEFDVLVLRRWSGVARPSFPFTHALSQAPWAGRARQGTSGSQPWDESRRTPPAER